jgi:hypothetical protein
MAHRAIRFRISLQSGSLFGFVGPDCYRRKLRLLLIFVKPIPARFA